jgi:hypothetical protein
MMQKRNTVIHSHLGTQAKGSRELHALYLFHKFHSKTKSTTASKISSSVTKNAESCKHLNLNVTSSLEYQNSLYLQNTPKGTQCQPEGWHNEHGFPKIFQQPHIVEKVQWVYAAVHPSWT